MGSYENSTGTQFYLDSGDVDVKNLKQMQDHFYQTNYTSNAAFWQQGSIDKRFKAGDQSLWSMIYGDNQYYQARRFFFNLIRRHINMICGFQRRNRKSTITVPTLQTDELSDEYNQVMKWCEDRDGFQEYISQAFEGACDTGMSLLHLYPDYTYDPISGDLFTDNVGFSNFLIDSNWRKMDFSDCNGIWRRRWVSKVGAEALIPGYAKEIKKMRPSGLKDGRFPLQAELLNLDRNSIFTYDEFNYRTTREAKLILDPYSGEAMEWEDREDEPKDMMEQVLREQPWLIVKKTQVPTVKLVISLNGNPVYHGPNLLNIDSYPFVPVMTYHEPDIQSYQWRVQGIIRNLRDAQYLYNMRKVIELDLLQSQVQNAWVYPVDVVVDPKAFRQTQNGCLIPLKAGKTPDMIQRLEPQGIPQSLIELSASLAEDITKISGVNEELLGSATDDKSGILSMLRQGAGLTTLQTIFDKLDYSQRLYGKLRLQTIRKNFSRGKVTSILGKEPSQNFFTTHSLKYGLAVEEGNYSATQRQAELQQVLHFRELGVPIANKTIMRLAIITDKKLAEQEMQEEQQAQQQQQAQEAQLKAKIDESKVVAQLAKAENDRASAAQKIAQIDDTHADAEHKRAQADLDLVKMMVELEDMDLNNYKLSLDLAQHIKAQNQQQPALSAMESL